MNAETSAGQAKQYRLFGGEIRLDVDGIALRYVADVLIHDTGRFAEHRDAAGRGIDQTKFGLHHRGLACAVGAHDGGDRTAGNAE